MLTKKGVKSELSKCTKNKHVIKIKKSTHKGKTPLENRREQQYYN